MNNGMPNNLNNFNGANSDPISEKASNDLMGGQSTVGSEVKPMQGMENVIPTPSAFQGLQSVNNNPGVMQGLQNADNNPEQPVIPGQGNSGINNFTMQNEPVSVPEPVNVPETPVQNPINNNLDAFDKINEQFNNNPADMNQPMANTNPIGMNQPMDNNPMLEPDMGNVPNEVPTMNNAFTENNIPQNDNLNTMPGQPVEPSVQMQPQENNQMDDSSFSGPLPSQMNNPINNPVSDGIMMGNANPNPVDMNNVPVNNQINEPMMNNQIGNQDMNNNFAPNQIGQMNMNNEPMQNGPVNQNVNEFAYNEKEKKFPLSIREIVLIAIALIGIIIVLGMYVFGWFK